MTREQLIEIIQQNESYKMKIQRTEQSMDRLQSRYYDSENELNTFKKKYDFLKEQFKEIVRECFPREYINGQMKDFSEKELHNFLLSQIRTLESQHFNSEKEKNTLESKINEIMDELDRLQKSGQRIPQGIDDNDNYDDNGNSQNNSFISTSKPVSIENNENPLLATLSKIEEREWAVIKIIGEGEVLFTGISTKTGIANATVSEITNDLQKKGILNFEKINAGGRGRPSHNYFLTPLGASVYKKQYCSDPIITTLEKMSTHGSPSHGGLMVEVGEFLQSNGCEVYYDGADTLFKLSNSREIKFDIKAYDRESKKIMVFETERAKCGDEHLLDKFDKCLEFTKLLVTKTIHIIAPDKATSHIIQQQLFKWINRGNTLEMLSKDKDKDRAIIIFKTATIEDFKKGMFQEFCYAKK